MNRPTLFPFSAALILLLALAGCQAGPASTPDESRLYDQLGERAGIEDIVEDLLYLIVDDPRLQESFAGIDVARFHEKFSDQICELSDGPCTYDGMTMIEAHTDMGVTDTQFNAVADHLIRAMEKNDVPTGAQNRLLARLVPLYPEIQGR